MLYREPELRNEIDDWRSTLRRSGYLDKDVFCSINEDGLDLDFKSFIKIAKRKRIPRIEAQYLENFNVDSNICQPVFVTPNERKKYSFKDSDLTKELIISKME